MPQGDKLNQMKRAACCGLLLFGAAFLGACGCNKQPVGGKVTEIPVPTGSPTKAVPTLDVSNYVTPVVSVTPELTKAVGATLTPELVPSEAIPSVSPEVTPETTPELTPEATPTESVMEPTPAPTMEPELPPEITPEITTEPTPEPTLIPEITEQPQPEITPTPIPEFSDAERGPAEVSVLIADGWQRTEDFYGEKEIYFPGSFSESDLTVATDRYLCTYRTKERTDITFLIEGNDSLQTAEWLEQFLTDHPEAEIYRYATRHYVYRYTEEGTIVFGHVYDCTVKRDRMTRVEIKYPAEPTESGESVVFYIR